ncbi:MAG: hypothetical protein M0Q21_03625 [Ignavibacteriaceae bacterium]|jgi:uncharacterized membrane protein|nr:hypothetical protein [Ignavibacteriaceae bacterium]
MFEAVIFKAIHIISIIVWLGVIPADFLLRKLIREKKGTESEKTLLSFWLKLTNLGGMVGLTGVLVTGILMSMTLGYGFFQFASGANHWLYTKQFLMVIVIILTAAIVIPSGRKVRIEIEKSIAENSSLSDGTYKNISKLGKVLTATNIIIVLNLLLALTRNLM